MQTAWACLIVAACFGAPIERHDPDAATVFHADFESHTAEAPDDWPIAWQRAYGPGLPRYLKAAIVRQPSPSGDDSLKFTLDGGGIVATSERTPIDPRLNYRVELQISTAGLKHDHAWAALEFQSESLETIATEASERVTGDAAWRVVGIGPVVPPPAARWARISLRLEPPAESAVPDITGAASFDAVTLISQPRVALDASDPNHLYRAGQDITVSCLVTGVAGDDLRVDAELRDALGRAVPESEAKLELLVETRDAEDMTGGEGAATIAWREESRLWRIVGAAPGYYWLHARVRGRSDIEHVAEIPLAVYEAEPKHPAATFGWMFTGAPLPSETEQLAVLAQRTGIGWVKLPLWFAEDDPRYDEHARLAESLRRRGTRVAGILSDPPPAVREKLTDDPILSAVAVFTAPEDVWLSSLTPLLLRLGLQVDAWQLGDDDDTSIASSTGTKEVAAAVQKQFATTSADATIVLPWPWTLDLAAAPRSELLNRDAPVAVGGSKPLDSSSWNDSLRWDAAQNGRRWVNVSIDPHAPLETRASDLVSRMVAAKVQGAGVLMAADVLQPAQGFIAADGAVGPLYLPWRTASLMLERTEDLGSLCLPGRSSNRLLLRAGDAVLVAWADSPRQERLFLGDDVRVTDVWGRTLPADGTAAAQEIAVGAMPVFVTGLDADLARFRAGVKWAKTRLPSQFGANHSNSVTFTNTFPRELIGTAKLISPPGWRARPSTFEFRAPPGADVILPYSWQVPLNGTSGEQAVTIEFDLQTDRPYKFAVHGDVEVGLGDVRLELITRIDESGMLEITQRMRNSSNDVLGFRVSLYAPGRTRERFELLDIAPGEFQHAVRLSDGAELIGQTLWIRAEQIGGPRILSQRFVVAEPPTSPARSKVGEPRSAVRPTKP